VLITGEDAPVMSTSQKFVRWFPPASRNACPDTDGLPGGVNGPLSDVYFYSHFQIDAQGSIALNHGLQFVVYGLNLNNEVFGFYQGSPQYMIQREYYQPTVAAGFRWSPYFERK